MESVKEGPDSVAQPESAFHFCEIKTENCTVQETEDCTMEDPLEVTKSEEQFGMEKVKEEPTSYSASQLESLLGLFEVKEEDCDAQDPISPEVETEEEIIKMNTAKAREAGISKITKCRSETSSYPINISLIPNVLSCEKKTKLVSSIQEYDISDIGIRTCLSLSLSEMNRSHSNVTWPEGDFYEQGMSVSQHSFTCDPFNKSLTEENGHGNHQPFCSEQSNLSNEIITNNVHHKTQQDVHNKQTHFKCGICSKMFTRPSHLKRHNLVHTDQRPFKCDICSKAFKTKGNLKCHQSVHAGQRSFKCDICNKICSHQGNLQRHQLVHIDQRSLKCDVCNKIFTCQRDLVRHELIHTGKLPFECRICKNRFRWTDNLKKHQLIYHTSRLQI